MSNQEVCQLFDRLSKSIVHPLLWDPKMKTREKLTDAESLAVMSAIANLPDPNMEFYRNTGTREIRACSHWNTEDPGRPDRELNLTKVTSGSVQDKEGWKRLTVDEIAGKVPTELIDAVSTEVDRVTKELQGVLADFVVTEDPEKSARVEQRVFAGSIDTLNDKRAGTYLRKAPALLWRTLSGMGRGSESGTATNAEVSKIKDLVLRVHAIEEKALSQSVACLDRALFDKEASHVSAARALGASFDSVLSELWKARVEFDTNCSANSIIAKDRWAMVVPDIPKPPSDEATRKDTVDRGLQDLVDGFCGKWEEEQIEAGKKSARMSYLVQRAKQLSKGAGESSAATRKG
jgi:hypothetical protein